MDHRNGLWVPALLALRQIIGHRGALLAMAWAGGMACDLLLSPIVYPRLGGLIGHSVPLPQGPTLLGWLYLAPVLLAQSVRGGIGSAGVLSVADALTTPAQAARWSGVWWTGLAVWVMALLPVAALGLLAQQVDGSLWCFGAWGVLLLGWLWAVASFALSESPMGAALPARLRVRVAGVAGGGLMLAFILSNLVVGLIFLPLLKGAGDSGRALGALLIILSNLGVALMVVMSAAASVAGWQEFRKTRWQRAQAVDEL